MSTFQIGNYIVKKGRIGRGSFSRIYKGYHKKTREICTKYDVIYISDEIVTGFGRLGHIFASENYFDLEPDIILLAKGITSGYVPCGAVVISEKLMSQLDNKEKVISTGAVDVLVDLLKDTSYEVRERAAGVLSNLIYNDSKNTFVNTVRNISTAIMITTGTPIS